MAEETKSGEQTDGSKAEEYRYENYDIIKAKFLKDLFENPRYDEFFSRFNPISVKIFKESYAWKKTSAAIWGPQSIERYEGYLQRYTDLAWDKIWEIQQRKLFDMQCYWRAEQIKIPEIVVSYDFHYWSERIEKCPFLSPISEIEFERYIQFLEKNSYDDIFDFEDDWQDYKDFKAHHLNIDDDFASDPPVWYDYYEGVTGLSSLYLLRDYRGEKEKKYMHAVHQKDEKEFAKKNIDKPPEPVDERPMIDYYSDETLKQFMEEFEEFKFRYGYECNEKIKEIEEDEQLQQAIITLKIADRPVYLDSNIEWQKSIMNAANEVAKIKIIEALPGVYKNYLFRIENGLDFEEIKRLGAFYNDKNKELFRNLILEGRELLGEPRDFNF